MTYTGSLSHPAARVSGAALLLALFAAAMWFAWLGWDQEYYEVDGEMQGPYRAWQVIGCGVSIALGAVVAQWLTRSAWGILVLAPAAILGFAVPWTADAAASDDSGLFVIGLFLLVVGGGIGLAVVLGATVAVQRFVGRGSGPVASRP